MKNEVNIKPVEFDSIKDTIVDTDIADTVNLIKHVFTNSTISAECMLSDNTAADLADMLVKSIKGSPYSSKDFIDIRKSIWNEVNQSYLIAISERIK